MKKAVICFFIFTASIISAQQTSLRDTLNQYDYVIITIPELKETCESFKEHKENYNDFSVLITTKNEILSEFTDSVQVEENIRDFISYAATYWSNPTPKYFLFAGDVDRLPNFKFKAIQNPNYPDSVKSDFYYGINKFDNTFEKVSLFVGRVAARTSSELANYFNKVINYESNYTLMSWHNKALFAADDGFTPTRYEGDYFENLALAVSGFLPNYFNNIYVFESDSSVYFGNTDSLINQINSGVSSIFFSGHGNSRYFTHEGFFDIEDAQLLQNANKPFFFGCTFGQRFSTQDSSSIIDQFIFSESGALCGIVPLGLIYLFPNNRMMNSIWNKLYTNRSIGQVFSEALYSNILFNEKRKYNIFGDPSIILKYDQLASSEDEKPSIPNNFELHQNFPNPFNPSTTISFSIPSDQHVSLDVFDILGNKIVQVINKTLKAGNHQINFDGSGVASGIYFYRLSAGENIITKKMTLLK